jgi:Rieske Fe-S protein
MLKLSNIKIFVLSLFILFTSSTCRKDNFKFPYARIDANIGIYSDLGGLEAGGVEFFPRDRLGGVGGIIVCRDYNDEYFVYDAACTHDYFDECIVEPGADFEDLMVCPCCSSSFLLSSEGNVFNGPAKYPLVEYQAFLDGGFLRVVN